jgi:hypothetical protein
MTYTENFIARVFPGSADHRNDQIACVIEGISVLQTLLFTEIAKRHGDGYGRVAIALEIVFVDPPNFGEEKVQCIEHGRLPHSVGADQGCVIADGHPIPRRAR